MRIKLGHSYTSEELAKEVGALPPAQSALVEHLATDSREVQAGDLFVCLRGEHYDGHNYLSEARKRGAALFLCESTPGVSAECAIVVKDTEGALAMLAGAVRKRINPTVIAVTGSVGKTTTKDMIAAVLETQYPTHKTEGNHNNLLGLSLTLLAMPRGTRFLVVELGMNHAREIARLAQIAEPDVAVITNVGHAHIGHLGSREAIAQAKLEILEGCAPGTIYFYPADEPLLVPARKAPLLAFPIAQRPGRDNAFFDVQVEEEFTRFSLDFRRWRYEGMRVRGVGRHIAACAAFAVCIGDLMGIADDKIEKALLSYDKSTMRQHIFSVGSITVIEDCYNASPESMAAALAALCHISEKKRGRPIALLGGMKELGEHSKELHHVLGRLCAEHALALLFPFGEESEEIACGAREGGMAKESIISNPDASDPRRSADAIAAQLQEGDVLLIKASRALAAERVSASLVEVLKERRERK